MQVDNYTESILVGVFFGSFALVTIAIADRPKSVHRCPALISVCSCTTPATGGLGLLEFVPKILKMDFLDANLGGVFFESFGLVTTDIADRQTFFVNPES